jgi:hypothetical protein
LFSIASSLGGEALGAGTWALGETLLKLPLGWEVRDVGVDPADAVLSRFNAKYRLITSSGSTSPVLT